MRRQGIIILISCIFIPNCIIIGNVPFPVFKAIVANAMVRMSHCQWSYGYILVFSTVEESDERAVCLSAWEIIIYLSITEKTSESFSGYSSEQLIVCIRECHLRLLSWSISRLSYVKLYPVCLVMMSRAFPVLTEPAEVKRRVKNARWHNFFAVCTAKNSAMPELYTSIAIERWHL